MLKLIIVSPEHLLFEGEVESVTLPGTLGLFTVLPEHAPIISSLQKGTVEYSIGRVAQSLPIKSGFAEVKYDQISVCVEQ